MSGNIDLATGAYNIIVTPAPTLPINVIWECRRMFLKFIAAIDTTVDYRIEVATDKYQPCINYDQANECLYSRNTLSMYDSLKDFVGRDGFAEGIGVGDGVTTVFNGVLTKFLGATVPGTKIQEGSITVLVWCDNVAKYPKMDIIPVQVCAYDDGAGNLNGVDNDLAPIWGTINYATGAINLNFGDAACIPTDGANVVVHYTDDVRSYSALQEVGWYGWKKKGSRLSILRNAALYFNE